MHFFGVVSEHLNGRHKFLDSGGECFFALLYDCGGAFFVFGGLLVDSGEGCADFFGVGFCGVVGMQCRRNGRNNRRGGDGRSIDAARNKWEWWQPATKWAEVVVSKLGIGDAAGGFYQLHAAGDFITNGPISLGRDRDGINHIAGEAGREWVKLHADGTTSIVPIENQRYLKPYAETIAGMIGGGNVYNITLDYKAGDDANKIFTDFTRMVKMQSRLGA